MYNKTTKMFNQSMILRIYMYLFQNNTINNT